MQGIEIQMMSAGRYRWRGEDTYPGIAVVEFEGMNVALPATAGRVDHEGGCIKPGSDSSELFCYPQGCI
jgi:hypothetical protein